MEELILNIVAKILEGGADALGLLAVFGMIYALVLVSRLTRRAQRKRKGDVGDGDDDEKKPGIILALAQAIAGSGGGTKCQATKCGFNGRESAALVDLKDTTTEMRTLATLQTQHTETMAENVGELVQLQRETIGMLKGEMLAKGRRRRKRSSKTPTRPRRRR